MGGLEFLAKLKQLEQENQMCIHVSIITSSSYPSDKQQAQQYGVHSYLLKPVTEEKLKESIPR